MIGLGSSIAKPGKIGKRIVRDGLVLKHDYNAGAVEPCSTGAAYFDGTDDYISIGNAFNLGAVDFSMACWIWVSTKESQDFISKYEDDDNRWYLRTQGNGYVQFAATDNASGACDHVASTAVPENEWVHIAITNDRSDGSVGEKIYINGAMTNAGGAATTVDVTNTGDINIAKHSTSFGESYMCNVGIWSGAALTQAQVKSIMHKDYAGLSASEKTNLVSWWNLDSTMITNPFDGDKFGVLDSHYGGGSELSSEMWDGTNGDTTHWVKFGSNNEISSDDGAVKITYKDDASGYYVYLKEDSHLTADLVVGKFYRLTFSTKINNGSVTWSLKDEDADSWKTDALTSTSFITQQIDFVATATEDHYIYPAFMDGSEEVWIKDISLKLINGNHGTLS